MAEIETGSEVQVREVDGGWLTGRCAVTGAQAGREYIVVWVALKAEWEAAQREDREPDAVPWPVDDVRVVERELA